MLIIKEFIILFLLSLLSFLKDLSSGLNYYEKCLSDINFHVVLFTHHLISVFSVIGWLSSNKLTLICYILVQISICIQWFIFRKCILVTYIQENCKNRDIPFRDIYYFLNIKEEMRYIVGCFVIITMIRLCI